MERPVLRLEDRFQRESQDLAAVARINHAIIEHPAGGEEGAFLRFENILDPLFLLDLFIVNF